MPSLDKIERLRRGMRKLAGELFKMSSRIEKHNKKNGGGVQVETRLLDETAIHLSQKSREIK